MATSTAVGTHSGTTVKLPEQSLSTGDIVLLQAGDMVPADLRLIEARGLEVDEWELTGELLPVEKRADGKAEHLYRGSKITRGSGKGVVTAVGSETEYGGILKQSLERQKPGVLPLIEPRHVVVLTLLLPPLLVALSRHEANLQMLLLWLTLVAASIVLQNRMLFQTLLTTAAMRSLAARGIEVRDAGALAVVSRVDVVCVDKTGVLTTLDVEVSHLQFADAALEAASPLPGDRRGVLVGIACALCNDVYFLERRAQAAPIDAALIDFARRHDVDDEQLQRQYARVYDKPFESDNRYMAAGFERGAEKLWFAKGDPEVVLRMCSRYMAASGETMRVDAAFLSTMRAAQDSARQKGHIVLALAYSQEPEMPPHQGIFLCLVCLQNPLRPSVPGLLRDLSAMGIRSVMLTGDRAETAVAIASEAGIGRNARDHLTGKEIERMPLQEVARQALYVSVFARLLPSQKGVIVRLLQRNGHCVAMVGDGSNDTVALRVADVGLSFVEDSSPFARSVSRILLKGLGDTKVVLGRARRLAWQLKCLDLLRGAVLIAMLVALYWGALV